MYSRHHGTADSMAGWGDDEVVDGWVVEWCDSLMVWWCGGGMMYDM